MAEQRLIDANALEFEYDPIDGIMNKVLILGGRNIGKTKHFVKTALKQMIDNAPTVDAVEVVRCKDCIYRGRESCSMYYDCDCGEQHTWETDNDFCSYGERKDTDDTK